MDDGLAGDFQIIYDGYNTPSLIQYAISSSSVKFPIVPGRPYRFRLAARSFNGLGSSSDIKTIYACSPPSGVGAPKLKAVDSTTMTLSWVEPTDNGSCPIEGY
jgi:hypothetical protein